jgi:hypothetical protein
MVALRWRATRRLRVVVMKALKEMVRTLPKLVDVLVVYRSVTFFNPFADPSSSSSRLYRAFDPPSLMAALHRRPASYRLTTKPSYWLES